MVEAVLDRIEAAITALDFAALDGLATELEGAMTGLAVDEDLRRRAARVARRLGAVVEGMRAAQWRLDDIRAMGRDGDRLVTYDGQGRRQDAGCGGRMARRV